MWLWIGIGLGAFVALSLLIGAALAVMLGAITHGVTEMHEELFDAEAWTVAPPTAQRRHRPRRKRLELELHP